MRCIIGDNMVNTVAVLSVTLVGLVTRETLHYLLSLACVCQLEDYFDWFY